jgi:hypothetical protein
MARGHGDRLSLKREQAISALLSEATIEAAAGKVGVDPRTLKRWLALPGFAAAYRAARQQVLDRTVGRLLSTTDKAVQALDRNLTCGAAHAEIRAAVAVLEHAARGVGLLDLAAEVAAIKRQLEELNRADAGPATEGSGPAEGVDRAGTPGAGADGEGAGAAAAGP